MVKARHLRTIALALATCTALAGAACSDSGDGETESDAAFCEEINAVDQQISQFDAEVSEDESPAEAEQRIREQLGEASAAIDGLLEEAPAEVKPDLETMAEGFKRLASGDSAVLEDSKYDEANDSFSAWVSDNCGFDLSNER